MAAGFDVQALRAAYNRYPAIKIVMDYVAGRKNNAGEMTADRLETIFERGEAPLTRGEIIQTFKDLENLGLGQFMVGRRGQPTRFIWRVQMIEAGRSARGEAVTIPALGAGIDEQESTPPAVGLTKPHVISHFFNLRPEFTVEVALPKDFSEREAARFSEFVRTLPFEPTS